MRQKRTLSDAPGALGTGPLEGWTWPERFPPRACHVTGRRDSGCSIKAPRAHLDHGPALGVPRSRRSAIDTRPMRVRNLVEESERLGGVTAEAVEADLQELGEHVRRGAQR